MSYTEFTGKTVKDAIRKACEELSVEEALLEIDVLEESTKGFLGIVGHRDARIRVKKRDILREVMEAGEEPLRKPEEVRPKAVEEQEPAEEPESEPEPEVEAEKAAEEQAVEHEEEGESEVSAEPANEAGEARTVLETILEKMAIEAKVEGGQSEGAVWLDIKGDGSGLLIGRNGQTLDALQFLVNKIVNKHASHNHKVDIIVDTENYRQRKEEKLREKALRLSNKAKKTLKPAVSDPMPAGERRIVHLILSEDREVYTKSYGEEPRRRIIVYPRRGVGNKRRGR